VATASIYYLIQFSRICTSSQNHLQQFRQWVFDILLRNYARPPPSEAPQPAPVNNPSPHDRHNHPNQLPVYTETAHRVDDEILCSKTVWIIAAVIGVIILTLILLFALGVIGGKVASSPATPAAPSSSPTATTPHHLTFRDLNHDGKQSSEAASTHFGSTTNTLHNSQKNGRHSLELH
jgi:hypothetical protein